ncbi:MAG: hypothetical protein QGG40_18230, partial [Myxococcota bacterium]|nr:hypothetical protein [Myxococcota bacterium]
MMPSGGIGLVVGLWMGLAWADPTEELGVGSESSEPEHSPDPEGAPVDGDQEQGWEPDEGMVVFGDGVDQARGTLDRTIRAQGYYRGERRGDRTVYLAKQAWKPKVVVHDEGFMVLRRGPVRLGMPREAPPWTNLLCPLALPACVRIGGQIISPRKLEHQRSRVI